MTSRGYTGSPVNYQTPTLFLKKDSKGVVIDDEGFLTWTAESHSLAFYLLWQRYHWESSEGTDTIV
eukprot:12901437-Prorocentrum_lima.AAC.1